METYAVVHIEWEDLTEACQISIEQELAENGLHENLYHGKDLELKITK